MSYTVEGTGPQFREPYVVRASTAAEALTKHGATERLCGRAAVKDAQGREVGLGELRRLAAEETDTSRRQLGGRSA